MPAQFIEQPLIVRILQAAVPQLIGELFPQGFGLGLKSVTVPSSIRRATSASASCNRPFQPRPEVARSARLLPPAPR